MKHFELRNLHIIGLSAFLTNIVDQFVRVKQTLNFFQIVRILNFVEKALKWISWKKWQNTNFIIFSFCSQVEKKATAAEMRKKTAALKRKEKARKRGSKKILSKRYLQCQPKKHNRQFYSDCSDSSDKIDICQLYDGSSSHSEFSKLSLVFGECGKTEKWWWYHCTQCGH